MATSTPTEGDGSLRGPHVARSVPQHQRFLDLFRCPTCGDGLRVEDGLVCLGAGHRFPIENGILQLFVPNAWDPSKADLTSEVKKFYEKTPFPNYDDSDSVAALMQKSRKGVFAQLLDEQIPIGARVLEVGCGTGQLSNFLAIGRRDVFGVDMCMNSLGLAEGFRRRNQLTGAGFYQMNLFRPFFRDETFDLVVSNGVLHHTSDPRRAFLSIAPLVKKGGYMIIGLYNRFGRTGTNLRRLIFRVIGKRLLSLDPYLKERGKIDAKTDAWFADQYRHPLESGHTMGEVLKWYSEAGFEFINSIPKISLSPGALASARLFERQPSADAFERFIVQARMIITGNREGGLFVMIGRRRLA